jgi:dihydrofolate reductase
VTISDTKRKVVLYQLLSLDGVAEEPGDWFFDGGPEVITQLSRAIASQDDVLLGRGTYDYWVGYWPTSEVEPFATFINGVRKHVVTSSEPAETWANSVLVTTPVAEYVAALKQQPGRDIGIHGSIVLAQSLLRARLVDELRLVVAPSLAGRGRRLFASDDALDKLELVDVERSAGGALFLGYRRVA